MAEGRSYKCARCGGTFVSAWSEEEAKAEAAANFGPDYQAQETDVICDDCYRKFKSWFDQLTPADHEAIQGGSYEGPQP